MKTKTLLGIFLMALLPAINAQTGITWNTAIDISTMSMYGNEHPRIVLDRSGDPMVLWGNSGNNNAYFSKWNGTSFSTPAIVNTALPVFAASWAGPDITAYGDTVYVVVKETPETSNPAYLYTSYNGGNTFNSPVQIDGYIADSISRFPTITTDNMGNPVVGFMKFNPDFSNARWAITKSNNYGVNFSPDVLASDWSGGDVCDCCPGTITSTGNTIAMMYRDNNANIRDMWAGISNNGGNTFNGGFAIDSPNWMLMMCPSSGPDGVIIGDHLYSVLMSGYTGNYLTYLSKSTISTLSNDTVYPITGLVAGLTIQNYPRIATDGSALGIVWKQTISGTDQLPLLFTNNINNGLPTQFDTVDIGDITNADIAIDDGKIHIVWQDNNSGKVRYRSGTFVSILSIENPETACMHIYPNPSESFINVQLQNNFTGTVEIRLYDELGKNTYQRSGSTNNGLLNIDVSGLTNGRYILEILTEDMRFTSGFIKK